MDNFLEKFLCLQHSNLTLQQCHAYLRQQPSLHYLPPNLSIDTTAVSYDLSWNDKPYQHIIHYYHKDYPLLLKQINLPPWCLYVKGNIKCLATQIIAIVGTRIPSSYAKKQAYVFAEQLASIGFTICSGLAYGIDASSHLGAIKNPSGLSIGVLAAGLNNIYPKSHYFIAKALIEQGCILSEYSCNIPVKKHHFLQRNRIISGISQGVLVVEAKKNSGSLITAQHALEQNRELFALPGEITNPNTTGTHWLIQQGAKLTTHINDICAELCI